MKKHTPILENMTLDAFKECGINIKHFIFLPHYDKYRDFRKDYPVHRYLNHLISEQLVISTEFWEILDFIFATSFSCTTSEYSKNRNPSIIAQKILEKLKVSTNELKH